MNQEEKIKYLEAALSDARIQLDSHRRKCSKDHVLPLALLRGLPIGVVITKEFDETNDQDYWEIVIGEDHYRGVDLLELLTTVKS